MIVTSRHVMHAMSKCSKSRENVITTKFNVFDAEYGIYFTSETGFLSYFHLCFALIKISKILSHSWNKFIFKYQTIEYPLYIWANRTCTYIFLSHLSDIFVGQALYSLLFLGHFILNFLQSWFRHLSSYQSKNSLHFNLYTYYVHKRVHLKPDPMTINKSKIRFWISHALL